MRKWNGLTDAELEERIRKEWKDFIEQNLDTFHLLEDIGDEEAKKALSFYTAEERGEDAPLFPVVAQLWLRQQVREIDMLMRLPKKDKRGY